METPRGFTRRGPPRIGAMRHVVWICTTLERPDDFVSTWKTRPGVIKVHARIRAKRPDQILDYQAVFGAEDIPVSEITIRMPPDVKIDLNHWVYQEAPGPAQIWYKVRSIENIGEADRFLVLNCSVDTVNDSRAENVQDGPMQIPPVWESPDDQVPTDDQH